MQTAFDPKEVVVNLKLWGLTRALQAMEAQEEGRFVDFFHARILARIRHIYEAQYPHDGCISLLIDVLSDTQSTRAARLAARDDVLLARAVSKGPAFDVTRAATLPLIFLCAEAAAYAASRFKNSSGDDDAYLAERLAQYDILNSMLTEGF